MFYAMFFVLTNQKENLMKKTLSLAAMAAVFAAPAMAANLENPLYSPKSGEFYSKTGAGLMYKKADDSQAMLMSGRDGGTEWPIYRVTQDFGFGITDRLSVNAGFGWTQDNDIDRAGMHNGRLGLNLRVLNGQDNDHGLIWDVYADAHLGGVMKMKGSYDLVKGFKYDNYTNGRWGVFAGSRVGKTWDKFTLMGWTELHQTFGNHNNAIDTKPTKTAAAGAVQACLSTYGMAVCMADPSFQIAYGLAGLADELSVNLKSTLEFNTGVKAFYELDDKWSFGGGFTFKTRENNGIKGVHTQQSNPASTAVANALAAGMYDMRDGWDEYILSAVVMRQLTESVQVGLYAEYTFDSAEAMSQNGTDIKAEAGVRVNVAF